MPKKWVNKEKYCNLTENLRDKRKLEITQFFVSLEEEALQRTLFHLLVSPVFRAYVTTTKNFKGESDL